MNSTENNIEALIRQIKAQKSIRRVFLQIPPGLKTKATKIAEAIERAGYDVVISNENCYGACDLRINDAEQTGCDLIVHIGHFRFPKKNTHSHIPILFYPWPIPVHINEKLRNELKKIKEKRIGLLSSIQYSHALSDFASVLKSMDKKPIIGGEILGCWTRNADKIKNKIDAFLFIGSGEFHALGLTTKKPIYFLDLEKANIIDMNKEIERQIMKKQARIAKFRDAKSIGLLLSSKPGQFDMEKALRIKKELSKKGKKVFLLIMDEINNDKLLGVKIDAFINLACPRLRDDHFYKPVINGDDTKFIITTNTIRQSSRKIKI